MTRRRRQDTSGPTHARRTDGQHPGRTPCPRGVERGRRRALLLPMGIRPPGRGHHPRRTGPEDDPAWAGSGAADVDEYARWASHVCGMACLKMVLAARTGRVHPTLALARGSLPMAPIRWTATTSKGMIYAPFVRYVDMHVDLATAALPALLDEAEFFMASVHPSIRWPDQPPPKKGGHLVLVTRAGADEIVFHNPSGEPVVDGRHTGGRALGARRVRPLFRGPRRGRPARLKRAARRVNDCVHGGDSARPAGRRTDSWPR